jgi:hypothetical protein
LSIGNTLRELQELAGDQLLLAVGIILVALASFMLVYGARFSAEVYTEDAIGSHACSLEASRRVTNGIPLGCPLFLPVHPVNCVQTPKEFEHDAAIVWARCSVGFINHAILGSEEEVLMLVFKDGTSHVND